MAGEDRLGFIHGEAEIKILILYILGRLPSPIGGEELAELVLIDGGLDYFEYKQYLWELVETAHVESGSDGYIITAKGRRNGEILETFLPFSVRRKADRVTAPIAEEMRRRSQILANHEPAEGGTAVYLGLSDGVGGILDIKLLASGDEQAERMEKNFRAGAEEIYQRIVALLESGV